MSLRPLLWKIKEKLDSDDIWPKSTLGASLVYTPESQRYFLIGGNFNSYENYLSNEQLNNEIISSVNKNMENYYKLESQKISYISNKIFDNNLSNRYIEVYIYELYPEKKWTKPIFKSKIPKARSFQKCVYHSKIKFI